VSAALDALNSGGYAAMKRHRAALEAVFAHAPATTAPGSHEADVYGMDAVLLAMQANEDKRHDQAEGYARRALVFAPDSTVAVNELAAAYNATGRSGEALKVLDEWLGSYGKSAEPMHRARMLRAKGFALIELKRLDEAEAIFKESLRLEPNHSGALGELEYIAELRKGGATRGSEQVTADKARTGK
jgi:tetratricopeptide (TPR) repeat protein